MPPVSGSLAGEMARGERQSVHVRLPGSLLAEIRELADSEGVSVNTLIATLLAGAVSFDLAEDDDE